MSAQTAEKAAAPIAKKKVELSAAEVENFWRLRSTFFEAKAAEIAAGLAFDQALEGLRKRCGGGDISVSKEGKVSCADPGAGTQPVSK